MTAWPNVRPIPIDVEDVRRMAAMLAKWSIGDIWASRIQLRPGKRLAMLGMEVTKADGSDPAIIKASLVVGSEKPRGRALFVDRGVWRPVRRYAVVYVGRNAPQVARHWHENRNRAEERLAEEIGKLLLHEVTHAADPSPRMGTYQVRQLEGYAAYARHPAEVAARTQVLVQEALEEAELLSSTGINKRDRQRFFDLVVDWSKASRDEEEYMTDEQYNKLMKTIYAALVEHGYL